MFVPRIREPRAPGIPRRRLHEALSAVASLVARRLLRWTTVRSAPAPESSKPFADGERDLVDECSWESFPASDPPSFNAR
ncbi:MAG TPA: hypothetical protein VGI10_11060 [Polyangiaceae bacterium]|jgi:hypothetical protein